jgi:YD repeat-containing protein
VRRAASFASRSATPGSDDVTVFEYWSVPSDGMKDGFLQNFKRKTDATNFLVQSSLTLDFWGNATSLQDADGTISCQTFDTARNYLSQRRETMAGQTDCTENAADLVTSWTRDSALRLTQLTRPDGSCMIYEYDTRGRLSKTKRRDDCNAASSGDREEFTYSAEGLLIKTETFDASSVVTRRQELTYLDSRRLEKIVNPVNTAKWTGMTYDPRGMASEVFAFDGTNNLSKTAWTYNADGRVDTEKRYTTTSAFDSWTLLFDWIGNQLQVTDGDSKVTKSTRDDLGRVVKLDSPDLGGHPTLRLYDAASRLVGIIESLGGTAERTHVFTFDNLGRPLNADYAGDCAGVNNPDIQRAYDTLPTGVNCPFAACNNVLRANNVSV